MGLEISGGSTIFGEQIVRVNFNGDEKRLLNLIMAGNTRAVNFIAL